jgi:DNA-binding response OmpR family regulator
VHVADGGRGAVIARCAAGQRQANVAGGNGARVYAAIVSAAARILLVEDDAAIGSSLVRVLEAEGYDVDWHTRGLPALDSASEAVPDLVVLDLGLPDIDGVELCRRLRARPEQLAIVMLTARAEEIDVVLGLDAGADDYLTKPFRLSELLARVRAHLRRRDRDDAAGARAEAGALVVDRTARRAWHGETELELRPKEFDLLALLTVEAGRAVTRERIMSEVWDENWFGPTKTLDQHIAWLRQKLEAAGCADAITTLRGVGYRLELR